MRYPDPNRPAAPYLRKRPRCFAASVLALALLAGCRSADKRTTDVVMRDSADVRIIENGTRLAEAAPSWVASPQPALDIGVVEGPEEYRLFRVADALLLPDGGVLLVNAGTAEIRHFDGTGAFVSAFGRSGEGPGEFRVPTRIDRYGADSVVVWDEPLRRLSVFTLSGTFGRQVRPEQQAANPSLVTAFADGSVLIRDDRFDIPASGFNDMDFTLVRYSPVGAFEDSAGTYYYGRIGRLGDVGMIGSPVFGAGGAVAGCTSGFWIADGRTYEVRRHGPDGTLLAIVRWSGPARSVEPEDVDAHWSKRGQGLTGDDRRRMERMREVTPVEDQFPATSGLQAAPGGGLWVEAYRPPRATGPATWWVFDEGGTLVGTAAIPATLRITDIGNDVVLGIERDSLDIEHVRLYRLLEP